MGMHESKGDEGIGMGWEDHKGISGGGWEGMRKKEKMRMREGCERKERVGSMFGRLDGLDRNWEMTGGGRG